MIVSPLEASRNRQEAIAVAIARSLPGRLGSHYMALLRAWIDRHRANSLAVQLAPALAIGSTSLLLFASPLMSTGKNALLVLLALVCCAFWQLVRPTPGARAGSLDAPFLATIAMALVAVACSPYLLPSLKGLAKLLVFWSAFLVFRSALETKQGRRSVFGALLLAGVGQGLLALWQHHIHVQPLALWENAKDTVQLTRVYGTLRNPNLLGGYLLPMVPFTLGMAAQGRRPSFRLLGLLGTAILGAGILFTYSRGAYLGVATEVMVLALLSLIAWWPRIRTEKRVAWLFTGLCVAVLLAFVGFLHHSPALRERLLSITDARQDSSNSFRLNVWHSTLLMIKDSWWAGVGVGNLAFRKGYALYMMSGFEALGAYNIFLETAAEMGLFGLLIFLWLLRSAAARAWEAFAIDRGPERIWAAAALAALMGLLVHGLFDTVFYRPSVQLIFWLLLALIARLRPQTKGTYAEA